MYKRIIKILAFFITFIVVIVFAMIMLMKAGYFNSYIAERISFHASKNINADLKVESITGNIFKDFQINNILFTLYDDTLLNCDQIEIVYDIKQLIKKNIDIKRLHISEIYTHPVESSDSVWNFTDIKSLYPSEDTTKSEFNWDIILREIHIHSFISQIDQFDKDTYIPEYVESNINLAASYMNGSLQAFIDTLSLFSENPDTEILLITGNFSFTNNRVSWKNFVLELDQTRLESEGQVDLEDKTIFPSYLSFIPFNLEDIHFLLPGIDLYGSPDITAEISGNKNKYDFNVIVHEDQQKIELYARLENVNSNPIYEFKLEVDSLDGEYWTHNDEFRSLVKGTLYAKGQGFDYKTNNIELEGSFGNIQYGDYSLKDLVIESNKRKGQLTGKLHSKTWIGDLNIKFGINSIFDNPQYEFNCDYQNLNLKGLPNIDSISTNLNGNIYLSGQGKTLEELNSKLVVNSYNSKVRKYPIHDFKINANYNKGNYNVEGLHINTPFFELRANGRGNVYHSNNIDFEFFPGNFYELISEFEIPIYSAQGIIKGNISGSIDSLRSNATVDLSGIRYDSIRVDRLTSDFNYFIKDSLYHGNINLNISQINYYSLTANQISLENVFSNNKIKTNIDIDVNDSLKLKFKGKIESFKNLLITVNLLNIDYNTRSWHNDHDSTYILLHPEYAYINRFSMNSGKQQVKLHGYFTFAGDENLDIQIKNFDLEQFPFQKFISYPVKGMFNSTINLTGTSEDPVIQSNILINNLSVNNYPIENLTAKISYENDLLNITSTVNSHLHRNIKASAKVPLHLSISEENYLLKENPDFSAFVRLDSVDIKKLYSFYPVRDISASGVAFANLSIENTMNNPNLNGNIKVLNGYFENKAFGAYYKNIELHSVIQNNRLNIQKFNLSTNKKGVFNLNGFVDFKSELAIIPNDFELHVKSTNFQALKSSRVELNFDSDLLAEGTFEEPSFKGNIKISRSRINADYFGKYLTQKTDDPNPPLLIAATQDSNLVVTEEPFHKPGADFSGTKFYKNLNGEAQLQIPGNTWIRGKDMNFEIGGNLRILKSENMDLFGTLNVKRGFYKIYGKNFTFNKGELNFTGGNKINPQLDFIVVYRFRDIEKHLRKLSVIINGRLNEPELSFLLDEENIEEKDAIAYVVFGKSVNQLSESQLNKLSGNDNFALNLALDQISDILKETLQTSARLDVVEITGGDNWRNNSVTLGKYITNKLYLSYEQSFSLDKKSKFLDSEKLMLEYQLLRNIILKGTNQNNNSGFDLIFKKSWK